MKHYLPKLFIVVVIIAMSCKKDDPAPLGAQVNAALLAGESGKSKTWKITKISVSGSGGSGDYTLDACFSDNLYTFTNNAAQDYQANEGATKCSTNSNDLIERGTWAFTLDGILINIGVDEVNSLNGLFSPDAIILVQPDQNDPNSIYPLTLTYPYPAAVVKLTADSMILEMNNVIVGNTTKYTLTFAVQ